MDGDKLFGKFLICVAVMGLGLAGVSSAIAAGDTNSKKPPVTPPLQSSPAVSTDPLPGTMPEAARLERIASKRPADKAIHIAAARHYLEQSYGADSRLVDASRHVNAVLAAEPGNFDALMLAGEIASRRGQADAAVQQYRNATLTNPTSREALLALSGALEKSGDHTGADATFAKFRVLSGMPPVTSGEPKPAEPKSK